MKLLAFNVFYEFQVEYDVRYRRRWCSKSPLKHAKHVRALLLRKGASRHAGTERGEHEAHIIFARWNMAMSDAVHTQNNIVYGVDS